jgi:hypothetical protein
MSELIENILSKTIFDAAIAMLLHWLSSAGGHPAEFLL